jgi:hypothetical protein
MRSIMVRRKRKRIYLDLSLKDYEQKLIYNKKKGVLTKKGG